MFKTDHHIRWKKEADKRFTKEIQDICTLTLIHVKVYDEGVTKIYGKGILFLNRLDNLGYKIVPK